MLGGGLGKKRSLVPWPGLEVEPRRTGEPGALQQQQKPESQRQCASEPEGAPESWRPIPVQREAEPGEKGPRNRCDISEGSETQTHPSRSNSKGISVGKTSPKSRQRQFLLLATRMAFPSRTACRWL